MILSRWLPLVVIIGLSVSCRVENGTGESVNARSEALLYISDKDGGFNIYKNLPTGGAEIPLTGGETWEWNPQYALEKDLVIYNFQDTSGNFSMRAMTTNGEEKPLFTEKLPAFFISPNGEKLAFTRERAGGTQIIIASFPGLADSLQVTEGAFYHGRPNWAPDSRALAFISDRTGSNELYRYDLGTGSTTQLTNNQMREKYISWAPSADRIAVTMREDSTENDIYLIDLNDGVEKQLTDTPINESEIAWSVSGEYLAYHARVGDADDIFIITLADGTIQKVTASDGYHGEPVWIWQD